MENQETMAIRQLAGCFAKNALARPEGKLKHLNPYKNLVL
jgi:hypothetical protein